MSTDRLERPFFTRRSDIVARELIGCLVSCSVAGACSGRIVETEAYGDASDLASHTAVYPRARAHILAREPGTIYVYRSYGIHLCLNIVAHVPDSAGAVLIRAIEPVSGIEAMGARRRTDDPDKIGHGPGNVAQALGISMALLGDDVVVGNNLKISPYRPSRLLESSRRIGITRDIERMWRFFDAESSSVSRRTSPRNRTGLAC